MTRLSKFQKQFTVLGHEEQGQACRYRVRVNGQETWLIEKDMTKSQREVLEKYRLETFPEVYHSIKDYKIGSILDIYHSPKEGEMFLVNFSGYVGPIWHYWVPRKDIKMGVKDLRAAYTKKKAKEEADRVAAQVNNGVSGVPNTSSTSTTSSTVDASANSTAFSTSSYSAGSTFNMVGDQNSKEEKKVEQKREVLNQTMSGTSTSATSSSQVVGKQTVKQKKNLEEDPRRENFLDSSYGSQAGPSSQNTVRNTASSIATSSSNSRSNVMDFLDDMNNTDVLNTRKLNQTSSSSIPKKATTVGSSKPEGAVLEQRPMSTAVSGDRENISLSHKTANKKVTEEKEGTNKDEKVDEVNGSQQETEKRSKRVLEKEAEKAERELQKKREENDWERNSRMIDEALLRMGPTARFTTTTTQRKSTGERREPPSKMAKTGSGSKLTTVGFASSSLNGRPAPVTFLPTSQASQQVHCQNPEAPPRQAPPQRPSLLLQLLQASKGAFEQQQSQALQRAQQQLSIPVPPPLRRPVEPVLELLVENDAAEEIDLPAQGVNYTRWNTDETVSWVQEVVKSHPRLPDILSRIINGKMTGVIIEEFINEPTVIDKKLNLTTSQLLRAKALAPFTINKQRRAVYQEAVAKYNIEMAQWRASHPEEQE